MKNIDWNTLAEYGITPDRLSVGGSLDLRGTAITALPDGLSVGGYLDLEGTAITALPDGLSVGGSLYLRGTAITALPDGLSVGGSLDLEGTAITALPDGLSVGGSLYLEGISSVKYYGKTIRIENIDGYSMSVGNWRKSGDIEICKAKYFRKFPLDASCDCYIARSGDFTAHGDTIQDAKSDLQFKIMQIDLDVSELVREIKGRDCVTIPEYRALTGACSSGVREFLNQHNIPHDQESMPLGKVMEITRGAFGGGRMQELFLEAQQ